MATTSLWKFSSRLRGLIDYVSNDEKTNNKEFVSGINCLPNIAYQEMMNTKKQFFKTDVIECFHGYQSFVSGEVTPEIAHEIGVKLAEKLWGDKYQVIVATHFNTGTYHNHFVVNSVNMFTGKKFNCNKGAYYHFRELSDELCKEYGLTVIEKPKRKTPRNIYFAEKRGEPTQYNLMRQATDEAMEICVSYSQFKKVMYKKGYIINDDNNRKYPTIRSINDKKAVRMYQLGEKYLPKNIAERVFQNPCYVQDEYYKLIKPKKNYTKF